MQSTHPFVKYLLVLHVLLFGSLLGVGTFDLDFEGVLNSNSLLLF